MKKNTGDTTIRVSNDTRIAIAKIGEKGDSYEDILRNVICFWIKAHNPASAGVCICPHGECIDPCDDCPNMQKVVIKPDGQPDPDTLCKEEQGSEACYKIACPTCPHFWKKDLPS